MDNNVLNIHHYHHHHHNTETNSPAVTVNTVWSAQAYVTCQTGSGVSSLPTHEINLLLTQRTRNDKWLQNIYLTLKQSETKTRPTGIRGADVSRRVGRGLKLQSPTGYALFNKLHGSNVSRREEPAITTPHSLLPHHNPPPTKTKVCQSLIYFVRLEHTKYKEAHYSYKKKNTEICLESPKNSCNY